ILWLTPMDWLALSIGRSGSQPLEYSRMDYMKRLNQILDILIGCFIGAFLGSGVSRFLDFKSHPDLYAIQSAPWYASIISQGIIITIIVIILILIKVIMNKKK
ncbi:hypothetical protein, partial [Faecalitalea cylindroides]